MNELYKVMDDLLDVEFQMKAGIDILKEMEEMYMSEERSEESEERKLAVLMRGYMQSMKMNLREIISYIDDVTLQKENDRRDNKKQQKEAAELSKEVREFVDLAITEHMGKAYEEWKLNRENDPECDEIEKGYQELLKTLTPEQEDVITKYCNAIFSDGADTEEFFCRLGLKDGLHMKSTVKSVVELLS